MKSLVMIVTAVLCTVPCATASVVQPLASAPELLIPVAGSTPGANGTFFRSDITIGNFADHDQRVRLQWLPQEVSSTFATTITLRGRSGIRSADFVRDQLGQSGLGAILLTGVTDTGAFDPTAALYVSSRIWTPQPGTGGTTSQTLPAVPTSAINTTDAIVFSLGTQNSRTNVGFVNLDPKHEQTFLIIFLFSPLPIAFPVTVPPMSMQQASLGSGFPAFDIALGNDTPSATRSNRWIAYSSTIDNITGDAWSELAVAGGTDINPPGPIGLGAGH